jgi:hypothetical protein
MDHISSPRRWNPALLPTTRPKNLASPKGRTLYRPRRASETLEATQETRQVGAGSHRDPAPDCETVLTFQIYQLIPVGYGPPKTVALWSGFFARWASTSA